MGAKKILVVEDDLNLGFLLMDFLQSESFEVKLCRDGRSGLEAIQNQNFDLCLLDVMMPKLDGYAVAQTLKKRGIQTPFLFVTAKSMKEDRLKGYALGAEDYITKPFDEEELLCKINVILRRQVNEDCPVLPSTFSIGAFLYNHELLELTIDNQKIRITEKENEVLQLLCLHKNRVLKRDDAVAKIYGRNDYFLGRSFDVYISRLRKILKRDPTVEIQNIYKVGFMLSTKQEQSLEAQA